MCFCVHICMPVYKHVSMHMCCVYVGRYTDKYECPSKYQACMILYVCLYVCMCHRMNDICYDWSIGNL